MEAAALIWLILLPAGAFYLLLWRPQKRRMAAVRELQAALSENDAVMTTSGIFGTVRRLGEDDLDLEVAPGTVIRVARGAIAEIVPAEDVPAEAVSGDVAPDEIVPDEIVSSEDAGGDA